MARRIVLMNKFGQADYLVNSSLMRHGRDISVLAQIFSLGDPIVASNPTAQREFLVEIIDNGLRPQFDLRKPIDAHGVEFLLQNGANAVDFLEIIDLRG